MEIPFIVGNKYRNRHGEYKVIELDGPRMVLRYTDGRILETNVTLQARIWQNIQFELQARTRVNRPPSPSVRQVKSSSQRAQFAGLQDGDFQLGISGTSWRSRKNLGGLLARELSDKAQREFQSYPVPRRPQVHIVQPERHRNGPANCHDAKFIFTLNPENAYYGFYIEKNDGPMDGAWRWPHLLAALGADEALQAKVLAAMRRLDLQWEIHINSDVDSVTYVAAGEQGLIWRPDGGDEEAITWPEFVGRLSQLDGDKWCDLYLGACLAKPAAIARGIRIAQAAVDVYHSLLPLYDAAAGEARS